MPSDRELQFAILKFLLKRGRSHKRNTLGRANQAGDLELMFNFGLDGPARARADFAWDRLQRADLIRSDYDSLSDPEQVVEITEGGRIALERNTVDDLDDTIASIKTELVEVRDMAWAALDRPSGPSTSQAGSSMCELIDQLLRAGAPESEVRLVEWFKKDRTSGTRITRRNRARFIMEGRHGGFDEDVCAALVLAHKGSAKLKHAAHEATRAEGVHALTLAEESLRQLLLWPSRGSGDESEEER